MKNKKIPLRKCVVTGDRLEKKELIRIVKTKDGNVFLDPSSKANGKGIYIKNDIDVFNIAKDKKILEKELEVNDLDSLYIELEQYMQN